MKRRFTNAAVAIALSAAVALVATPANAVTLAGAHAGVAKTDEARAEQGVTATTAAPRTKAALAVYATTTEPAISLVLVRPTVASQPIVFETTTTHTYYYSRSNVEEMWHTLTVVGWTCHFLPLSYIASLGCGAPQNLANAITQAHYQKKRIKAVFYNCGFDYCNYYKYSVVK